LKPFTVAILADTHIRTDPHDPQAGYPSDALHNERARRAVALARARGPAFTVHLGDVTHTLPGLSTHEPAQQQARAILDELGGPLYVAPGNHDVGDKPDSHATAPRSDDRGREVFRRFWGPTWRSWDHGGCHFATLDTAVMNTTSDAEREQRTWLEADLRGHERIFLFLHYPPFILRSDEPAHYDNLAEPARSWLLDLARRRGVEAVFAGHVHNVFFGRHAGVRLYSLPSTAFVRPEYAELFAVAPADENGRNDMAKLGLALLHVQEQGHRIEVVRSALSHEAWSQSPRPSPLGVWFRGGWARTVDLPCGDLDEFGRKQARNDYPLLALLDLGMTRIRLPLSDLGDPDSGRRIEELGALGVRLLVFSVGAPRRAEVDRVRENAERIGLWEVILPASRAGEVLADLAELPGPIALSLVESEPAGDGYFSHFPDQGFLPDRPLPRWVAGLPASVTHLSFRIPWGAPIAAGVGAARAVAAAQGRRAVCHVQMPRGDEHRMGDDDEAVTRVALRALSAAEAYPECQIYLDTFEDKDRGYFPRHGLIDRRGNPRAAATALRAAVVKS